MLRIRSFCLIRMFAGAAVLVAAAAYPVFAASQAKGMAMMSMSHGASSMSQKAARQTVDAIPLGITGTQHITLYVLPGGGGLGFTGPDKAHHDTVVPSSFVLRRGVPVTVTVINLDDMRHSITAPRLGVNIIVKPGRDRGSGAVAPSTTTYRFTPVKSGEFRWFCVFPCDMPHHWAMSASFDGPDRDGFMAGVIRVL
jgi:heme/copper-type cytochrome/quinol oxidase subunit 2